MIAAIKPGSTWERLMLGWLWILRDNESGFVLAYCKAASGDLVWEFGTIVDKHVQCHGMTIGQDLAEVMRECEVTLADVGYTLAGPISRPD